MFELGGDREGAFVREGEGGMLGESERELRGDRSFSDRKCARREVETCRGR